MTFLPLFSLSDGTGNPGFGFLLVLIAILAVVLIVRTIKRKSKKEESVIENGSLDTAPAVTTQQDEVLSETPAETAHELPYTPGYITLDGVKEQDAAVIMAITSHETGIPLERLCFKYIKRLNQEPELVNIEEQDAAVVMAIVSDKTGISLENLIFNSIKLVEE